MAAHLHDAFESACSSAIEDELRSRSKSKSQDSYSYSSAGGKRSRKKQKADEEGPTDFSAFFTKQLPPQPRDPDEKEGWAPYTPAVANDGEVKRLRQASWSAYVEEKNKKDGETKSAAPRPRRLDPLSAAELVQARWIRNECDVSLALPNIVKFLSTPAPSTSPMAMFVAKRDVTQQDIYRELLRRHRVSPLMLRDKEGVDVGTYSWEFDWNDRRHARDWHDATHPPVWRVTVDAMFSEEGILSTCLEPFLPLSVCAALACTSKSFNAIYTRAKRIRAQFIVPGMEKHVTPSMITNVDVVLNMFARLPDPVASITACLDENAARPNEVHRHCPGYPSTCVSQHGLELIRAKCEMRKELTRIHALLDKRAFSFSSFYPVDPPIDYYFSSAIYYPMDDMRRIAKQMQTRRQTGQLSKVEMKRWIAFWASLTTTSKKPAPKRKVKCIQRESTPTAPFNANVDSWTLISKTDVSSLFVFNLYGLLYTIVKDSRRGHVRCYISMLSNNKFPRPLFSSRFVSVDMVTGVWHANTDNNEVWDFVSGVISGVITVSLDFHPKPSTHAKAVDAYCEANWKAVV